MIGRRSSGWFEDVLLDDLKKILWMVGKRYGGCLEEGLVDNWKKVW